MTSRWLQIAEGVERITKSRIFLSLLIATLVVVPASVLYHSVRKSWDSLTGYSTRAGDAIFPKEPVAESNPEISAEPPTTPERKIDSQSGQTGQATDFDPAARSTSEPTTPSAAKPTTADDRLHRVLRAWPRLPENVRQAIDTLVGPFAVED